MAPLSSSMAITGNKVEEEVGELELVRCIQQNDFFAGMPTICSFELLGQDRSDFF